MGCFSEAICDIFTIPQISKNRLKTSKIQYILPFKMNFSILMGR